MKSKILIGFTIATLLNACGGGSSQQPQSEPAPAPITFDYQQALNQVISEEVPGAILTVEKPGFSFIGSAGLADVESQSPMQVTDVMPNGSAGKKATALLVALLDQDGLLSLEDKITKWLPEEIAIQVPNAAEISIRQLLNHTSGTYDYLDSRTATEYYLTLLSTDTDLIKTDSFALPFGLLHGPYADPGEAFHYSNTGYLLVGLILDQVFGEHHSKELRQRILEPLGLSSSFYGGVEKHLGDIISGYFQDDELGTINTKEFYLSIGLADAPINSSVNDLVTLLKAIAAPNSPFGDEIQQTMLSPNSRVTVDNTSSYSLGLFKETMLGKTVYHHGGLEPGYTTENYYIADSQTSITAFFNCGLDPSCEQQTQAFIRQILINELKQD